MNKAPNIFSREDLVTVINALPIAISVIDRHRRVTLTNRATELFVNKNEDQLIGRVGGDAFDCIHHEDAPEGCGFGQECIKCRLRQTVIETLETQTARELVESTMVFKGRGESHLRFSTLPIVLDSEDAVLLSIDDITLARRHEQTRMEREKLAAAVETAGAICHEINQPLMVILGMAELLLEETDASDSRRDGLSEIREQAERLGKITRKLMTLTEYKTRPYLKSTILDIEKSSKTSREP